MNPSRRRRLARQTEATELVVPKPELARTAARRKIVRGLVLTASTPIAAIVAVSVNGTREVTPIILAAFYMAIVGGIGIGGVVIGLRRLATISRERRQLEEQRVPKARLLR